MKPQTLMVVSSCLVLLAAALNAYAAYCQHCTPRGDDDAGETRIRQSVGPAIAAEPAECDRERPDVVARILAEAATFAAAGLVVLACFCWVANRARDRPK